MSTTSQRTRPTTDVLVVGAGPTGLLLAGDLAAAGVPVTVVEKRPEGLSNLTRAFAVHARTLEVLDARGVADELVRTGRPLRHLRVFDRLEVRLDGLPTRFPFVLVTAQYEVERLLRRRAEEAGAVFRHDTTVTGLTQDLDGVSVQIVGPDGPSTVRTTYVVGADGVRSTMRDLVGIEFPGHTVIRSMVLADVRLADPPEDVLAVASRDDALGFLAPFGDGWYRFIGWAGERDLDDPVDLDEVRALARSTLGTDHQMVELRYGSRFAADERQAPTYRSGRVFLAGDAAHAHSPAGGLGMNTGLQDAANLAWRLAAVLHGADESVLDAYQAERHPVGKQVLRASGTILRLATRPGRAVAAARRLLTTVISHLPAARRRAAGMISALDVAYAGPRGSHRLVGRRVPDLPLEPGADGARLAEALRAGRFVLVRPADGGTSGAEPALVPGEIDVAERVTVRRADGNPTTLLVRPDGYLAAVA
jgi:2-polyprenyl-6-methoxyphenol hydroxylase-like FAD-dependent oxidoreductase